jgi:hypothetical protein
MVGSRAGVDASARLCVARKMAHARLIPAVLDIASPFTGMVLFVTRMSLIYDKNSINTIFTHIQ